MGDCSHGKIVKKVETKTWFGPTTDTSGPPDTDDVATTVTDQWDSCADEKCGSGMVRIKVWESPWNFSYPISDTWSTSVDTEQLPNKTFKKTYTVEHTVVTITDEGTAYGYACVSEAALREFEQALESIGKYFPLSGDGVHRSVSAPKVPA